MISFLLSNFDLQGLPIYINSTLSGARLYEDMGWKVASIVTVGDATVEGPGSRGYLSRFMVARFPPGKLGAKL